MAKDNHGNEIIILGAGVGFKKMPYELTDLSKIERSFYDVDNKYVDMITALPQAIILASADIIEQAEINLDCDFNPNLTFTLADHINFAIERMNKGLDITVPLAYDVRHLYPEEYELGVLALDIIEDFSKIRLPDNEIINIALHLITGQLETGDMHSAMLTMKTISEVKAIIEEELDLDIDENGHPYSRLATHLRYLIHRLATGKQIEQSSSSMLRSMMREYPCIYVCANKVSDYFKEEKNWICGEDELLYLMLHINRLKQKNEE